MSARIEQDIIEQATRIWTGHRRCTWRPTSDHIGLGLHWSGSSWYASCARYPARTPRRFAGVYASTPTGALVGLLQKLRAEG